MDYGNDRYRDDKYYDDYGDQYDSSRGQGNSYDQYPPSRGSRREHYQYGEGDHQRQGDEVVRPVLEQPNCKKKTCQWINAMIPVVAAIILVCAALYFMKFRRS